MRRTPSLKYLRAMVALLVPAMACGAFLALSGPAGAAYTALQDGLAPWQKCLRTSGINKALAEQGLSPDWDANIVLCEEALRLERDAPKVSFSLAALAQAYERKGQLDSAISLYREAVRLMSAPNMDLYFSLARLYRRVGQQAEAKLVYEEAVRHEPRNPKAHYQIGRTHAEASLWEDAMASYQEAVNLKPNMAEAHLALGEAYEKTDQWDKAFESYKRALGIDPDLASAHYGLGRISSHKGLPEMAIVYYHDAIRLDKGLAEAHYDLGQAYSRRGDVEASIAAYREAARLRPDLAEAHYSLGVAYATQKRRALADDYLYQAANLYIDAGDRKGALKAYGHLKNLRSPLAARVYSKLYP